MQYSDPIDPVAITATDMDSSTLTASTTWKKSSEPNSSFATSSPLGGLSLSGSSGSWTLSGRALVPADSYTVRVTVSDGALTSYVDVTITVTKENMTLTYTGQSFVSTPSLERDDERRDGRTHRGGQ